MRRIGRSIGGFTFIEAIVAVLILAIISLPVVFYIGKMLKYLVHANSRVTGQDLVRYALVDIQRDLKDMNEILRGDLEGDGSGNWTLEFYMDSYRAPWYNPNAASAHAGKIKALDPDDDDDALGVSDLAKKWSSSTAWGGSPIPLEAWKYGHDVDDDDDDNDGNRDVICRYRYEKARQQIYRDFSYNEGPWQDQKLILEYVTEFEFNFWGSLEQEGLSDLPTPLDGSTGNPPNGIIDADELEKVNGVEGFLSLNTFLETRFVTSVGFHAVVEANPKIEAPTPLDIELSPALLEVKRKYP